jgi:hypothetical protein
LADLPRDLNEVSGNQTLPHSKLIWIHNDSGNASKIYGVSRKGTIVKELTIDAVNQDWEDITRDEKGNLYIGDFGNNLQNFMYPKNSSYFYKYCCDCCRNHCF